MFTQSFHRKDLYQKFSSNIFNRKYFMVARSFPQKRVCTENFHQKYFGPIFFFCVFKVSSAKSGRSLPIIIINIYLSKIFYGCKTFILELVCTKKFHEKYLGREFSMVENPLPRKQVSTKISNKKFLVENFLLLKIIFSKEVCTKMFIKNFWSKCFCACKTCSS